MDELTPRTRIETFLDAIINNTSAPNPITRIEVMLNDIINGNVVSLTPITRIECFLANISGAGNAIPMPITRIEVFLAKKCGMDIETPTPITRIEVLLDEWAGGVTPSQTLTVTGISPLSLVNAIAHKLVSLTQTGKVEQASTPTPSAPKDIVCNNGALKYGVLGKNLFDQTNFGWSQDNTIVYIPIYLGVGTYTMSSNREYTTTADVFFFNGRATGGASTANNGVFTGHAITVTSTDGYVTVASRYNSVSRPVPPSDDNWQIEKGSTATAFEEYKGIGFYTDGTAEVITLGEQTAHAENLFAVGTYADTQEVISGAVTRNVGIKVFDGTESFSNTFVQNTWGYDGSFGSGTPTARRVVCSHFDSADSVPTSADRQGKAFIGKNGDDYTVCFGATATYATAADFKAWLAAQYGQGTPVIVLYPLAEAATEQVTGQNLSTVQGTNTLTVTANVSDIPLTVEYKGTVE